MHGLGAREHDRERLQRRADDVVERLDRRSARFRRRPRTGGASTSAGRCAPKRSRMIRAQSRRAARCFAISSKKSRIVEMLKENRGGELVDVETRGRRPPARRRAALASVNAISCTASQPAWRMW